MESTSLSRSCDHKGNDMKTTLIAALAASLIACGPQSPDDPPEPKQNLVQVGTCNSAYYVSGWIAGVVITTDLDSADPIFLGTIVVNGVATKTVGSVPYSGYVMVAYDRGGYEPNGSKEWVALDGCPTHAPVYMQQ
jgi:hypothetical protein